MINNLKSKFQSLTNEEYFIRIDESHPFDFYIGKDQNLNKTLLLLCDDNPGKLLPSNVINIFVGRRKDDRWAISFTLKDVLFDDQFLVFCNDIIEYAREFDNSINSGAIVSKRYIMWQKMLSKSRTDLLSLSEIKGLIGELIFLKDYLAVAYSFKEAVISWLGPFRADQDFIIENLWYEVKSTTLDSTTVNISSISQLDSTQIGNLVVIRLEKTSQTDSKKITLNSIIKEISDNCGEDSKLLFLDILFDHGYVIRDEYDDICFRFHKIDFYNVDETFPCIRKNSLPLSVANIEYQLLLSTIEDFRTNFRFKEES